MKKKTFPAPLKQSCPPSTDHFPKSDYYINHHKENLNQCNVPRMGGDSNGLDNNVESRIKTSSISEGGGGGGGVNHHTAVALILCVMTLILRVYYVTDRHNWVMIHPDEVFQSIEAGHIEYYGFGFRPYEFTSCKEDPPTTTTSGGSESTTNNMTQHRKLELEAGLCAMRSPLLPYYYATVAGIASALGVVMNPYLMFRLAHVLVTSSLPLAVYEYCTNMFHSRDVGILAAILTSSSVHLNILGSHCLLHSFLSPFLFLTLALVTSLANDESFSSEFFIRLPPKTRTRNKSAQQSTTNYPSYEYDVNNNSVGEMYSTVKKDNGVFNSSDPIDKTSFHRNKSFKQLYHTLKEKNHNQVFNESTKKTTSRDTSLGRSHYFTCVDIPKSIAVGFLSGFTSYIRPDVILVHLVNLSLLFSSTKRQRNILAHSPFISLGIIISLIVGVSIDTHFYGELTISPLNWFMVNVVQNVSTSVFGQMSFWFYFETFYSHDKAMCCVIVLALITHIFLGLMPPPPLPKIKNSNSNTTNNIVKMPQSDNTTTSFVSTTHLLLTSFGVLVVYSFHGHKEIRFISDTIIFALIFVALVIYAAISRIPNGTARPRAKVGVCLALLALAAHQWSAGVYSHSSTTKWTFQKSPDTQDTNVCLEFISKQPDVRGVFMESNLFLTGGMSILHKDVPIFSRVMNGFFEFNNMDDAGIRTNTSSSGPTPSPPTTPNYPNDNNNIHHHLHPPSFSNIPSKSVSVNTFTRVSDYVSPSNAIGAVRIVLQQHSTYNYLVVTTGQPFLKMGYRLVFQYGNRKVLKREEEEGEKEGEEGPVTVSVMDHRIQQVLDRYTE